MKKNIIISIALILCLATYLQARDLSPNFTIRYEDFINNTTPSAAIGLKLDIDGDRYTGFQVNSDGSDTRLLVGWNWGVIGIGSLTSDAVSYAHYTFGVGLEVVPGLSTNFEYCMTPDEAELENDSLRIALSINF